MVVGPSLLLSLNIEWFVRGDTLRAIPRQLSINGHPSIITEAIKFHHPLT